MTQAIVYGCNHGYVPGECPERDCRNSALAKSLYTGEPAIFDQPSPLRMRVIRLAHLVSVEYDVSPEALLGSQKYSELIEPRHVLYWLCRFVAGWKYPAIGRVLKRRHTAVLKGAVKIEQRKGLNEKLRVRLERLAEAAGEEMG